MNFTSALVLSLSLFSLPAFAEGIPGLASAYAGIIMGTRDRLTQMPIEPATTCNQQIVDLASDNNITITLAFGYMDVSRKQDFQDSSNAIYGPGDVLDGDARLAMASVLKSGCAGNNFACGFSGNSSQLTKRIVNRFTGQRMNVTINLFKGSISASDAQNRVSGQQTAHSRQTEQYFHSAFHTSDVVIYLGHARAGAGPDFSPPLLRADGSVSYGDYSNDLFSRMLGAISSAPRATPIIGLLACKSTGHFASNVKRYSPGSLLLTADDLFDFSDIVPTGYAMVEAVLSQRCLDDFNKAVRATPGSSSQLSLFP